MPRRCHIPGCGKRLREAGDVCPHYTIEPSGRYYRAKDQKAGLNLKNFARAEGTSRARGRREERVTASSAESNTADPIVRQLAYDLQCQLVPAQVRQLVRELGAGLEPAPTRRVVGALPTTAQCAALEAAANAEVEGGGDAAPLIEFVLRMKHLTGATASMPGEKRQRMMAQPGKAPHLEQWAGEAASQLHETAISTPLLQHAPFQLQPANRSDVSTVEAAEYVASQVGKATKAHAESEHVYGSVTWHGTHWNAELNGCLLGTFATRQQAARSASMLIVDDEHISRKEVVLVTMHAPTSA